MKTTPIDYLPVTFLLIYSEVIHKVGRYANQRGLTQSVTTSTLTFPSAEARGSFGRGKVAC